MLGGTFGYDHPGFHDYILKIGGSRSWWLFSPLAFGWSGVALFFVISGYVIHRSYLLSTNFTWLRFAERRFWRIYPAYIVFLIVFSYLHSIPILSQDFGLHILLIHNIREHTFFGGINGSFWSLAVECQLYALYPLAMIIHKRYGLELMLTLGFAIAAAWLLFAYATVELPRASSAIWSSPLALWPTWLVGAAIAEQHIEGRSLFKSHRVWIISMAALCVASFVLQPIAPLDFHFAAFGWAAALDAYVLRRFELTYFAKIAASVGLASYSIYLIHQPLIPYVVSAFLFIGIRHPALQLMLGVISFIPVASLLGWMSYLILEKNGAKLGQRFRIGNPTTRHAG